MLTGNCTNGGRGAKVPNVDVIIADKLAVASSNHNGKFMSVG